jgi:dTDP-D-glucose 4,6-dehydratase
MIADKIGYNKKKIKFGAYPPGYPLRPIVSDQPYLVLDATKINKALNWSPQVNLSGGLDKVITCFQEKQK